MHWLKPENDCEENPVKSGGWRRRQNSVARECSSELDVGNDKRVRSLECLVSEGYEV
jgi:hypothetical protein